jgi:hypothetical protein
MQTLNNISQLLGLIAFVAFLWLLVRVFAMRHILWGFAILLLPVIPALLYLGYFISYGPHKYHLFIFMITAFLFPVMATIYATRYWDDVKKPFLVYITTFVLSVALGAYVFTSWGGWGIMKASISVAEGIANEDLTMEDALKFMQSGLDVAEDTAATEQDRQVIEFERKFLNMFESGQTLTEEEQREINQDFLNLLEKSDLSEEEKQELEEFRSNLLEESNMNEKGRQQHEAQYKAISLAHAKDFVGSSVLLARSDGVEQECRLIGVSGNTLQFEKSISGGSVAFAHKEDEIQSLKVLQN